MHTMTKGPRLAHLSLEALILLAIPFVGAAAADPPPRPRVLAHYMPWFVAKPASPVWGWHWTMGAFDPEPVNAGQRPIASHYYPLIGPYDSGDPAVVEYHFLLLKLAGFDGVVVDWYGLADHFDYAVLHRNTAALFPAAKRADLKVVICYEDQTVDRLEEAGKFSAGGRVKHVREEIAWLREHWFADPCYLRLDGRPVLLSFGRDGLTDEEWEEALPVTSAGPVYLSEHVRRPNAAGAFDWPIPGEGLTAVDRFATTAKEWPVAMPAAFARFHDIYAEAKVRPSYGTIPDDGGQTYATTLKRALESGAPLVQVATWNDWGEGTMVEPSVEFRYRDLEVTQRLRRELVDPDFASGPDELRLAHRLYLLRSGRDARPALSETLDKAAAALAASRFSEARGLLDEATAGAR